MEEQMQDSWSSLLEKLSSWVDTFIYNLPNLLIAMVVFVAAYGFSRLFNSWLNRALRKFIKQPSIRNLISNITSVVIVMLGIILALAVMNLDGALKSLLAGAGVAGLAIGLALQGILSNSFSGVFLAVKNEMNVGDWVETNGYSGHVHRIELRNTSIKEADNNIVVMPNKMIVDNPFKNFGLTKRVRCNITCGVGYESDLAQVKGIAVKAIEEYFPTNTGEEIEFYYTDFGSSSIDFLMRFWVDAKDKRTALEVKSEAIMIIKKAFDENDINIPFPIRTLITSNEDSEKESE